MTKIPNLFAQNPLIISQGLHSQDWAKQFANVAIDFSYLGDLICPFDGCKVESSFDSGKQSYFGLRLPDGSLIICVHGYPVREGVFKKGETVGKCRWHHWHLSILVNNNLDCILNYLDRSITLQTQANIYNGDANHPDCHWDNYLDLNLNINQPISLDPMFQKSIENARNLAQFKISPTDIQESMSSDPKGFDPERIVLWTVQVERDIEKLRTEKDQILFESVKKMQEFNKDLEAQVVLIGDLQSQLARTKDVNNETPKAIVVDPLIKTSSNKPFYQSKKFLALAGLIPVLAGMIQYLPEPFSIYAMALYTIANIIYLVIQGNIDAKDAVAKINLEIAKLN